MKKLILMMLLSLFLQGCTAFDLFDINTRDVKGQDVDLVVAKIKSRGFSCGPEYQGKTSLGKVSPYGSIVCGSKGGALICRSSYLAAITFDMQTRKVLSVFKDERENCF
jgi:hypothetical protein